MEEKNTIVEEESPFRVESNQQVEGTVSEQPREIDMNSEAVKETLTPEQIEQMQQQGVQQVLKTVLDNKTQGLERFEANLNNLKETHMLSETTENSLRGIVRALDDNFVALDALNQFVDMIRHDMMSVMQANQQQGVALWQTSMQLQVLVTLLLKKKVISETQLQKERQKVNELLKQNMKNPS